MKSVNVLKSYREYVHDMKENALDLLFQEQISLDEYSDLMVSIYNLDDCLKSIIERGKHAANHSNAFYVH